MAWQAAIALDRGQATARLQQRPLELRTAAIRFWRLSHSRNPRPRHLQRSFPNVSDVHLAIGGVGRYHLNVQIRKTHEGQPKNIICAAFGAHYDIKQVIVVDEDVQVHDPMQVEWAVATRFQADRDLVVIAGAQGSALDPSTTVGQDFSGGVPPAHSQGLSAKMGLDATRPVVYPEHVFTKVRIPGEDEVDIADEIDTASRIDFEAIGAGT